MYVCAACMHPSMCMCVCLKRPKEGIGSPRDGILQAVVRCQMWVEGTELGTSGKLVSTLNRGAISSATR